MVTYCIVLFLLSSVKHFLEQWFLTLFTMPLYIIVLCFEHPKFYKQMYLLVYLLIRLAML